MEYGLIGGRLGHSWSQEIHDLLGLYSYSLQPLPTEEEAHAFMQRHDFKAINVTIPYKKLVIPYCAHVSEQAKAIGAVNTVVNKDGVLYGYNTDYRGFEYLVRHNGISLQGKTVMLLGTGATHNTVTAVCRDLGAAEILTVSRRAGPGVMDYAEAASHSEVQILINTSPAGMYPNIGECLMDISGLDKLEAVLDVVYNPYRTELLLRAERRGIKAVCGLEMLVAQAVFAAEYFLDREIDKSEITRIHDLLLAQKLGG